MRLDNNNILSADVLKNTFICKHTKDLLYSTIKLRVQVAYRA